MYVNFVSHLDKENEKSFGLSYSCFVRLFCEFQTSFKAYKSNDFVLCNFYLSQPEVNI